MSAQAYRVSASLHSSVVLADTTQPHGLSVPLYGLVCTNVSYLMFLPVLRKKVKVKLTI